MMTLKRISVAGLLAVASVSVSAVAFADSGDAKPQCEGKRGEGKGHGKGGLFKKADKNADGFLTKDEVGAERWERIKLADANKDDKVTQAEMKQARKDGKLPKGHRQGPKA